MDSTNKPYDSYQTLEDGWLGNFKKYIPLVADQFNEPFLKKKLDDSVI